MSKHLSHSVYVGKTKSEKVTFTYKKIEDILGLQLPKTAKNRRSFWQNNKNRHRIQNLLGFSCQYTCMIKLQENLVIFQKR
jgi:hypothetical protein